MQQTLSPARNAENTEERSDERWSFLNRRGPGGVYSPPFSANKAERGDPRGEILLPPWSLQALLVTKASSSAGGRGVTQSGRRLWPKGNDGEGVVISPQLENFASNKEQHLLP